MSILKEDLEILAKIGGALWIDSTYARLSAIETLTVISLMELSPEQALEKACFAMLERARLKSIITNAPGQTFFLEQRFFRLTPEERFLMIGLHHAHWSYSKLSRILQLSTERVQELAWGARVQMCINQFYPAGPVSANTSCPEYDHRKPWTQRFLDDEITARERFFLQNHLVGCLMCSQALKRSRELYFKVDQEVSQILDSSDFGDTLEEILAQVPNAETIMQRRILFGLWNFVRRKDITLMLLLFVLILVLRWPLIF